MSTTVHQPSPRRAWLGFLVLLVVAAAGCGGAADIELGNPAADVEVDLESLVRHLPEETFALMVVDAVMAADALGADRAALGRRDDLPPAFSDDGPDPDGQLGQVLLSAISLTPFETTHGIIDLSEVTGVVQANLREPFGGLIVVATEQPGDELVAGYTDGGFEANGDGRYVLPGAGAPGDASGGFPVVLVADGQLVLATSADVMDLWVATTGPADDVLRLLDAAGDRWATSIHLVAPDDAGAVCGDSVAIVSDGTADELLILDGGEDSVDRESADQLTFQIGEATPDGQLTRYPLTPSDPTPAALVAGGVLRDLPAPLSTC